MANGHNGSKRGFHWSNRAWYATKGFESYNDIYFGLYPEDPSVETIEPIGEMVMKWHDLFGEMTPRLEVYTGSWGVLMTFGDLLTELSNLDGKNITEERFVDILLALGFEDMTKYESGR